jgi:hypothetical protein
MRKISITFLLLLSTCSFANINYEELKSERDYCYQIKTSQCFAKLIDKYALATREMKNILYYDYGCALMVEENYTKAQDTFKTVLFKEKNNKQLIKSTQEKLSKINEINQKMQTARNLDAGNYLDKSQEKIVWQKPYSIKVYVASNTGKEYILKRALSIWDKELYSIVNFTYVNKEEDADMILKLVSSLDEDKAGVTKTSYVIINGKKYLHKANVEVALKTPVGGNFTDINLLSIALHEIGHSLGLNYHSGNLNDIMYYSTESYKNSSLSRRDVNTIRELYK